MELELDELPELFTSLGGSAKTAVADAFAFPLLLFCPGCCLRLVCCEEWPPRFSPPALLPPPLLLPFPASTVGFALLTCNLQNPFISSFEGFFCCIIVNDWGRKDANK